MLVSPLVVRGDDDFVVGAGLALVQVSPSNLSGLNGLRQKMSAMGGALNGALAFARPDGTWEPIASRFVTGKPVKPTPALTTSLLSWRPGADDRAEDHEQGFEIVI